jgi:hypothetical protein
MPPSTATLLPLFICECCTVRAILGRELTDHPRDSALMILERMRVLDMVHQWAPSTAVQYKGKIRIIQKFEQLFRCQVLRIPQLTSPPTIEAIPLMWAQQYYSLQQRQWTRSTATVSNGEDRVTYGTVRTMRSAASFYHTWMALIEQPGQLIREHGSARPMQVGHCIPTDGLEYSMMSTGMSRRLGENSKPAMALMAEHVEWINAHLEHAYHASLRTSTKESEPNLSHELAMAGACNLLAWLAWLRGGETFGVRWQDISMILPGDGESMALPAHVGAILIKLLEQTKTNRSSVADVVVAFTSGSGLSLGKWLQRIRSHVDGPNPTDSATDWQSDLRFVFCHSSGQPWDSTYFRHTYLLPLLQIQRLQGNAYLRQFDGTPGKSLVEAFYSMHCYRRGGRTQVSQKRSGCTRKATVEEVNEHGRWRRNRSSESMAEQYRQWPLLDRIAITILCM